MISAARAGKFGHLFVHQLDQLLREPCDVAELLRMADKCGLMLHAAVGERDLGGAARRMLLAEMTRDCQARRAASRSARAAHKAAAADGRPHGGGRRAYGYAAGTFVLIDAEAAVVREIFATFLAGESARGIALDLNTREIRTAYGGAWTADRVARVLDSPRYAGLRIFRGEVVETRAGQWQSGDWLPCVTVADWESAKRMRQRRIVEQRTGRRPSRDYLLTGLVVCDACERHMVGSMKGTYPMYACTGNSLLTPQRCSRHIGATRLEAHVEACAIEILRTSDNIQPTTVTVEMPGGRIVLRPPTVPDRIARGPDAEISWRRLPARHKRAALRFLFAAIRIGTKTTQRSVFDYDRVHIVRHSG